MSLHFNIIIRAHFFIKQSEHGGKMCPYFFLANKKPSYHIANGSLSISHETVAVSEVMSMPVKEDLEKAQQSGGNTSVLRTIGSAV